MKNKAECRWVRMPSTINIAIDGWMETIRWEQHHHGNLKQNKAKPPDPLIGSNTTGRGAAPACTGAGSSWGCGPCTGTRAGTRWEGSARSAGTMGGTTSPCPGTGTAAGWIWCTRRTDRSTAMSSSACSSLLLLLHLLHALLRDPETK